MSTYEHYTSEKASFTEEELAEKAQNLSVTKCDRYPYTGIKPDSMRIIDGAFCFDYVRVIKEENEWWDGSKRNQENFEDPTVMFLESGRVLIDTRCEADLKEEVIGFIETHFLEASKLVKIESGRKSLNEVVRHSSKLRALYSSPASQDSPEKQKASDKSGLKGTDYYSRNKDEPKDKVKVQLPSAQVSMDVGIDKKGNITLYAQELELHTELKAMKTIIEDLRSVSNNFQAHIQTRLNSDNQI